MNASSAVSRVASLPSSAQSPFAEEVYRGLTGPEKSLSPWLFYDAEGSRLFERITEVEEYYVTRTERAILAENADAILAATGERRLRIIELGAGTATKTGLLLQAAVRRQGSVVYEPIDVSAAALEEATQRIEEHIPGVVVLPRVADYTDGLSAEHASFDGNMNPEKRLVLYIGSSIGNFSPEEAGQLLGEIRHELSADDALLLGVDMVKPSSYLLPAYDDAQGVTAEFNLNVLRRINQELGANFRLDQFRHIANWNSAESRMEMHLVSLVEQQVSIPALELELAFRQGESIHTENSYKYTSTRIGELLSDNGFTVNNQWFDDRKWFGVFLASAT